MARRRRGNDFARPRPAALTARGTLCRSRLPSSRRARQRRSPNGFRKNRASPCCNMAGNIRTTQPKAEEVRARQRAADRRCARRASPRLRAAQPLFPENSFPFWSRPGTGSPTPCAIGGARSGLSACRPSVRRRQATSTCEHSRRHLRMAADTPAARARRGLRSPFGEINRRLQGSAEPIGIMTHHLVHEEKSWELVDELFGRSRAIRRRNGRRPTRSFA